MIERLLVLVGKLPTMQARVCVTLGAVIATTVRYVSSQEHVLGNGAVTSFWTPTYEWLGFLIVMSGLDLGTFMAKRTTDASYVAAKAGVTPAPNPPTPENAP
jgi:hypothetical protein